MKWLIPAKTFLLGEYAALAEASAIVVTTTPYFELTLTDEPGLTTLHPDSPAGLWWQKQAKTQSLIWHDPYAGLGGLGASSAQFLGSYLAGCHLQNIRPKLKAMLQAYYQTSWSGNGLRPSGYDVIAQSHQGCVYINQQKNVIEPYPWPFSDLSFFLIHTERKLATHHHLKTASLPKNVDQLSKIVDQAQDACARQDAEQFTHCINQYHQQLAALDLVAPHSLAAINDLKTYPEVLAVKGCGALGADVLLVLCSKNNALILREKLQNALILATEEQITGTNKISI